MQFTDFETFSVPLKLPLLIIKGRHGFPLWATLTPEQISEAVSRDLAADIAGLSRLAVTKFTCLRRAVDVTCVGGALLILAVLLAVGGAR